MTIFCRKEDLFNESDVEQKLVLPILTSAQPLGLGYNVSDFRTKSDLRRITVDKGGASKLYYPDYIIIIQGMPLMVIEVKRPDEDIEEALREARLYATEINASFPRNINPCHKIIVTNGDNFLATSWDTINTEVSFSFEDIFIESKQYASFIKYAAKKTLNDFPLEQLKAIRGATTFVKPIRLLGGKTVQDEELPENSFGRTLALQYRHIFNPNTIADRVNIVRNAYVASKKRQKHIDPIEKIIRAANPPSISDSQLIEDTERPLEILSKLRNIGTLRHEVLLLIGSVGSGKSTFVDYLREVGLTEDIKKSSVWIAIDLNIAPLGRDEIYYWLHEQLSSRLKEIHPEIDFDNIETLKKLYSVEIGKFEKGIGKLLGDERYQEKLADIIDERQKNPTHHTHALVRYLCAERAKALVIVLDNCDKRTRDDQLLMFEVAKWLQNEFKCLVFLPIRDTTFDYHRKEPPLDTVIKDLVFRIDPPPLMDVIYKRVKYALQMMATDKDQILSYDLPNGMRVEYPKSEQGYYMACILRSLFQSDNFFRRLIIGIAGRDVRKGLEIFLDFCKSGHISSSEILKIRQSEGNYTLPKYIVTRVLIRGNRRYFQDVGSHIKNVFHSVPDDTIPDPYARISILRWLEKRYRTKGPSGINGFHKVSQMLSNLIPLGHADDRLRLEMLALTKAGCIISESQNPEEISDDELIKITASGHVHLDLLENIDYLSSCAEDVWYKDQNIANNIALRLSGQLGSGHLTRDCAIDNAHDLVQYLIEYQKNMIQVPQAYLAEGQYDDLVNFTATLSAIEDIKSKSAITMDDKIIAEYPPGTIIEAEVVNIQQYGLFVEFGLEGNGFIHFSQFAARHDKQTTFEDIEVGDVISAKIITYKKEHGRFYLVPV